METTEETHFIHIDWDGPFTLEAVGKLHGPTDFGVYQIYGLHPVYGNSQLLYIGLAGEQTFGGRIPFHTGWCHGTRDGTKIEIYVGRISGRDVPDNETWTKEIVVAERLLIYAHYPPYNMKKYLAGQEELSRNIHILNWKKYRDLLPEVSGARWSSRFEHIDGYRAYSTLESGKPSATDPDAGPECWS